MLDGSYRVLTPVESNPQFSSFAVTCHSRFRPATKNCASRKGVLKRGLLCFENTVPTTIGFPQRQDGSLQSCDSISPF